jgi:hypothetical protein
MSTIDKSFTPAIKMIMTMVAFILILSPLLAQDKVHNVASHKQLFIDDQLISDAVDVKWRVNPPSKAGPVLKPLPDKEGPYLISNTILIVENEYWMYYSFIAPEDWLERDWQGEIPGDARHMTCLAKSKDGINWERVAVNKFDIGRGRNNAIIMPSSGGTVFLDPNKTRGSRFWFIGNITENPWWDDSKGAIYTLRDEEGEKVGGAMYLCHSKDGIEWQRIKDPVLPIWCDTQNQAFYDLCEPLRKWHRQVPSYYTFDDHEILDDSRGAGSIGHRSRIAVYRDIGVQAWYDYLGWSNPVIFDQETTFGMGDFVKNSDVLTDRNTNFSQINLDEASNLHIHWGDDYAWRHLKRNDGKGGVPNAGVYKIIERIGSHQLKIYPPLIETATNAYSIGRLSYFNWSLSNCEFFFLDTRSHRQMPITAEPNKPGQSILGSQQKAWLKNKMRNSTTDFLFVVSSVNLFIPHIVDAGGKGGPDDWAGKQEDSWSGFPGERSEMIAFWKSLGKPVLVLTGDLHNSFVARSGENLWEFASGPHSSGNARALSEGNRPANGTWEYRGETFDIRWSTYQELDNSYKQKVYCVVQVNNVIPTAGENEEIRWIAYPQSLVTVQYYDGLTGDMLYAESVLSK